MKDQNHSKVILIMLWIAKIILALSFIWAASLKLFQSIEKLSAMWPWTAQIPSVLVRFTGIIDLLGGIGIIAPALLSLNPKLTRITAYAIIVLMICAAIFHICRGEASHIGINVSFALLAFFIAWGRK
jgi:uncharacterized membrane protein YphA (DoxX/SURF4 family)